MAVYAASTACESSGPRTLDALTFVEARGPWAPGLRGQFRSGGHIIGAALTSGASAREGAHAFRVQEITAGGVYGPDGHGAGPGRGIHQAEHQTGTLGGHEQPADQRGDADSR